MKLSMIAFLRIWLPGFALVLIPPVASAWGQQIVVAPDTSECPGATFHQIQAAIDAANPGDHLRVCRGIYPEQLSITKALDLDADNGAILQPGPLVANTTSLFDGSPIAAAILVANASNVSITGLIVDGVHNSATQCSPDLIGIMFRNASGSIAHAAIKNFALSSSLTGCQSGNAIFVESGAGQSSTVLIDNCAIHDFQKNGITGNEIGTTVLIRRNVVTGIGPTTGAAQNGIQIGFGAQGLIEGNTVTNNLSSPCSSVQTCQSVATNILVSGSDGVRISGNTAGLSQVPIFIDGNNAQIFDNEAFSAYVFDALRVQGDNSQIHRNRLYNSSESAIYIMGNNNHISENAIEDSPIGILLARGAYGNLLFANFFAATPIEIQDPQAQSLARAVQPMR
jgi:nitrous oxidase accessory protein NosD